MDEYDTIRKLMANSKRHQEVIQNIKDIGTTLDTKHHELIERLNEKTTELHSLHKDSTHFAEIYSNIIDACTIK